MAAHTHSPARRPVAMLAAATVIGSMAVALPQADAGSLLKGSFRGNVYATFASARSGQVATTLGRSAYIVCPCDGTGGRVKSNTIHDVKAKGNGRTVYSGKRAENSIYTDKTASSALVRDSSNISSMILLSGAIKADRIRAVARTTADDSTINSGAGRSSYRGLVINGHPVRSPAPGKRIALPGVGYVALKHTTHSGDGRNSSAVTVNMLTVVVTRDNEFNLPIGARIIVGHAKSGFTRLQPRSIVGGQAYASSGQLSTPRLTNKLGRSAAIYLGCQGTHGKVRSNNVTALSIPGAVSPSTGKTTARSYRAKSGATVARTTASVQDLDLGTAGTGITASAVTAVAKSSHGAGISSTSTRGSGFVGLTIAGQAMPDSPSPNTRVEIPGVGYAIIFQKNAVAGAARSHVAVTMLHLVVQDPDNPAGLPVGTINVAHATSSARGF